jgi:hypothetical protein
MKHEIDSLVDCVANLAVLQLQRLDSKKAPRSSVRESTRTNRSGAAAMLPVKYPVWVTLCRGNWRGSTCRERRVWR